MTNERDRSVISQSCFYCNASGLSLYYDNVSDRLGVISGAWSFYECPNCSSLRLHPFPTPDILRRAYPENYCFSVNASASKFIRIFGNLQELLLYRPLFSAQMRPIVSNVNTHQRAPNPALLDVGCGKAERLRYFQEAGFQVHGLDLIPENVDWVRNNLQIPAVCGDAQQVAECFPQTRFHVITAFQLLEHLLDPSDFVQQCRRILHPGGALVLLVPVIDCLQARIFRRRWAAVTEAPRHVTIPSRKGLSILLRNSGYAEVVFIPDTALNSAGVVGTTLFPAALSAWRGSRYHWFCRLLAICASILALPFCVMESLLLGNGACLLVIARTPGPDGEQS